MKEVQEQLFSLQDLKYRDFHSKLMPNISKENVIGIRVPVLRKFAKNFAKDPQLQDFLQELPHQYYEENNLHMLLITQIKDYETCLREVNRFLPYIDNWQPAISQSLHVLQHIKLNFCHRSDSGLHQDTLIKYVME